MRIKSIELKDFKTYEKIVINCDQNFNVIIGPNNIGKSTIIEAILLWEACLKLFIQESSSKKLYNGGKDRYLSYSELYFLRITKDSDLFYGGKKSASVKLNLEIEETIYKLKFNIGKPESIKDSYFKVNYKNSLSDFDLLRESICGKGLNFKNIFYTYQTKPISQIVKNEPFYNNGQILKKISLGKSHELIRNKILKSRIVHPTLHSSKFDYLEEKLINILGVKYNIKCKNSDADEEYIKMIIKPESSKEIDISLMGSGFLQILEIFSTLKFISNKNNCLNVILIDEPDSHIHSNLQVNLLKELLKEEKLQIFIITHNENLIDSVAENGNILFINDEIKNIGTVNKSSLETFDYIKNELSGKLRDINVTQNTKNYIITEDEKLDYIKSFFEIHGYIPEETQFISYFGCDTIGSAIVIGKYIKSQNEDANIIIHRDRDYLEEAEIEIEKDKIERNGFKFFTTIGVDIESNFINKDHIHYLYPTIPLEEIEEMINQSTEEVNDDSLDRLLKHYASRGKSGVEYIKYYNNNKERFRYGKKVFGRLKGKIQNKIRSNPNLLQPSEFILIDELKYDNINVTEDAQMI